MKKDKQNDRRILTRKVAKPLDTRELQAVAGGGRVSCSGGCADDCQEQF